MTELFPSPASLPSGRHGRNRSAAAIPLHPHRSPRSRLSPWPGARAGARTEATGHLLSLKRACPMGIVFLSQGGDNGDRWWFPCPGVDGH